MQSVNYGLLYVNEWMKTVGSNTILMTYVLLLFHECHEGCNFGHKGNKIHNAFSY